MKPKLTIKALNEMLELDIDQIFTFTPATLRETCKDRNVAEELAAILQSMAVRHTRGFADSPLMYNNAEFKPREGFAVELSDHGWLTRMRAIAMSGYAYGSDHPMLFDADETPAVVVKQRQKDAPIHAAETGNFVPVGNMGTEGGAAKAETGPEYLLPPVRDGYFEAPNLITGTKICSTGARSKERKFWTNAKPLKIDRVLGQKKGAYEIIYTGDELRPGDIETFTQVLKQATNLPLGVSLKIRSRSLLQNIPGRGTGGNSYERIKQGLLRLQDAKLQIRSTCPVFIANLFRLFPSDEIIESAVETGCVHISTHLLSTIKSDGKKTFSIEVPPTVLALFGTKLTAWFNESKYYSLRGDTARRLYLLYGSQTNCWPLTLADMREFLGSGMEDDANFRKSLKKSHDELKKKGIIEAWRYEVPEYGRKINELCYVVAHKDKAFTKKPVKTAEG